MFTFRRIKLEELELIYRWRISHHVNQFMATDMAPDYERHVYWYKNKVDPTMYWMVCYQQKPIGVINLADYVPRHRRTSFGYYIGDKDEWLKGPWVLPEFYNYVFNNRGIDKITAEVLLENENMWKIHLRHGYEWVGTAKHHIYKNEKWHDVVILELLKDKWRAQGYNDRIGEFKF